MLQYFQETKSADFQCILDAMKNHNQTLQKYGSCDYELPMEGIDMSLGGLHQEFLFYFIICLVTVYVMSAVVGGMFFGSRRPDDDGSMLPAFSLGRRTPLLDLSLFPFGKIVLVKHLLPPGAIGVSNSKSIVYEEVITQPNPITNSPKQSKLKNKYLTMGILSEEAIALVTESFNKADADGSGTIDASEIEAVMAVVSKKEGIEPPKKEDIEKRLSAMPTQKEGQLNLKELLFIVGALKFMMIVSVLFQAADADGSGVLESAEIKNVLVKVHEMAGVDSHPEEKQEAVVTELGGKIYFDQFAAFMIPIILEAHGVEIIA